MTSIHITPWSVFIQALKNMTSARKGNWSHAIRVTLLVVSIGYGAFGLYYFSPETKDFATDYPAYELLKSAQGTLIEVRTRRTSYLTLLGSDKSVIPIRTNYTLTAPLRTAGFYDEKHDFVPRHVHIRWFLLPGTKWAWVAELDVGEKILISYEQRKLNFLESARIRSSQQKESFVAALIGLVVLVWFLVEAYLQLKQRNTHGK